MLSESVADRIRAFRAERLGRVVAGEAPVPIEGTSRVVLHVVPISAFDSPSSGVDLDIRRPSINERLLLPISIMSRVTEEELDEVLYSNPSEFFPRYNFHGVFCDPRLVAPGAGYVQLFRTGVIEAADNDAFKVMPSVRPLAFRFSTTFWYECHTAGKSVCGAMKFMPFLK